MKLRIILMPLLLIPFTISSQEPQKPRKKKMVTLPSGLKYSIEKPALQEETKVAQRGQRVKVHYTGWLEGKSEKEAFDSSVKRGQPFFFTLGAREVIGGWDEGVKGMKVGEIRRLYIPAALGYGLRGAPPVIPPNANLIFDVQLLDVIG